MEESYPSIFPNDIEAPSLPTMSLNILLVLVYVNFFWFKLVVENLQTYAYLRLTLFVNNQNFF